MLAPISLSAPLSYVSAHVSLSHLSNGSYQDSLANCQMVAIKSLSTPVSNSRYQVSLSLPICLIKASKSLSPV